VPRSRGPEEFFEVFREMQQSKKKGEEKPDSQEPELQLKPRQPAPSPEGPLLSISRTTAVAAVVAVVLLVVAAFLLGKQYGWRSHAAQVARKKTGAPRPAPTTRTPAGRVSEGPELVGGKIFTLLVSEKEAQHRKSAEEEAKYLNSYAPFGALEVEAYVWRDKRGRYRLCARGLAKMRPAEREQVKKQIRRLKSRFGKREYKDADFYPP